MKKFEVLATDSFKKREIRQPKAESLGVRIENNLLNIDFSKLDFDLSELADVMEVLFGLAHNLGYSEEDLLNKRREKLEERGGFKEGVVLKKVY